MKKINFQNNITKVNKATFDEFQNNIEESCVAVSPTQPETGEKVWIDKENGKIYVKNDDGVYEEFISKSNFTIEPLSISINTNYLNGVGANIIGYKIGKLCFANIFGSLKNCTNEWTDYEIATVNGITAIEEFNSPFTNQAGQIGDINISKNSNKIMVNYRAVVPDAKNSWARGQLIFICN